MDLERFVRISPRDAPERGGTGYLISGDRVLTALHVVREVAALAVYFATQDGATERTEKVEVLWKSGEALDVAVLGVATGRTWPRCALDGSAVTKKTPWDSRGWTRTAAPGGRLPVDQMEPLDGNVHAVTHSATALTLGVTNPPSGIEWWKGASGAPVFCGSRLVGVIRGGPKSFAGGRLRATALSALWAEADFLLHTGDAAASEERRRTAFQAEIVAILDREPDLAKLLAAEEPAWDHARKARDSSASLADAIRSSRSWVSALRAFARAHERLNLTTSNGRRLADLLVEIALKSLSEIYAQQLAPSGDGQRPFAVPFQTFTQAELYFAGYEGRPLRYQPVLDPTQYPIGEGLIPLRVPGTKHEFRGWNLTQSPSFDDWLRQFALWIRLDASDYEDFSRPGKEQELAERVNSRLNRDATSQHKLRRYLCFPAELREVSRSFVDALCSALPALFVGHLDSTSTRNQEREDIDPLALMLHSRDSQKGKKR